MRILITGGCGFIGSHLAEYHLNKGDDVIVIDDLSTGSLENINSLLKNTRFHLEEADILSYKNLQEFIPKIDQIYHMAGVVGVQRVIEKPMQTIATNILSCQRLLDGIIASGNKPNIIIASTSSVYGHSNKESFAEDDELMLDPNDSLASYSISKIASEILSLSSYHQWKLPIKVVRLFNTIGPRQTGQYGMVVPRFIQQACTNQPITIYGNGKQTRSFCDVRDVTNYLDILLNNDHANGEIINVGNDREISINELAELIRQKANSKSEIKYISYEEAYTKGFEDITHRRPDLTKLVKLTGVRPKWSLEQTIDDLIKIAFSR